MPTTQAPERNPIHPMAKAKAPVASLGGSADEVEVLFYEALRTGDLEKLMSCWADEDDIVCVHPGGPRLVGAGAIRAAFDGMFSNGSIQAWPERVRKVDAMASSVHNVLERIDVATPQGPAQAWVLATNVYHKTAQGWRLVVHHASPGSQNDAPDVGSAPPVLH